MRRVDRRTFLANSLKTGVVAVAAGSIGLEEWAVTQPVSSAAPDTRGQPLALSINGDPSPVGVDPDDASFAWELGDTRKGAVQTAYRLEVTRGGTSVWDSGEVVADPPGIRQVFRARPRIRHHLRLQCGDPRCEQKLEPHVAAGTVSDGTPPR